MKKKIIILLSVVIILLMGIVVWFNIPLDLMDLDPVSYTHLPGHADYVKNMITAAAQMDGAILVVAATDGVMAQTKEQDVYKRQLLPSLIMIFVD